MDGNRNETTDRSVAEQETLPFPRRRVESEQMTDRDGIRPTMRNESDPAARLSNPPVCDLVLDPLSAARFEEPRRACMDPIVEFSRRFATDQTMPTVINRSFSKFAIERFGMLGRRAVPVGISNLLEPRLNDLLAPERPKQRVSGLTGTCQWRNEYLVEVLIGQRLRHPCRLLMTKFGQRRVGNIQPISHPFGLTMSN